MAVNVYDTHIIFIKVRLNIVDTRSVRHQRLPYLKPPLLKALVPNHQAGTFVGKRPSGHFNEVLP